MFDLQNFIYHFLVSRFSSSIPIINVRKFIFVIWLGNRNFETVNLDLRQRDNKQHSTVRSKRNCVFECQRAKRRAIFFSPAKNTLNSRYFDVHGIEIKPKANFINMKERRATAIKKQQQCNRSMKMILIV